MFEYPNYDKELTTPVKTLENNVAAYPQYTFELGRRYLFGIGCTKNIVRAKGYFNSICTNYEFDKTFRVWAHLYQAYIFALSYKFDDFFKSLKNAAALANETSDSSVQSEDQDMILNGLFALFQDVKSYDKAEVQQLLQGANNYLSTGSEDLRKKICLEFGIFAETKKYMKEASGFYASGRNLGCPECKFKCLTLPYMLDPTLKNKKDLGDDEVNTCVELVEIFNIPNKEFDQNRLLSFPEPMNWILTLLIHKLNGKNSSYSCDSSFLDFYLKVIKQAFDKQMIDKEFVKRIFTILLNHISSSEVNSNKKNGPKIIGMIKKIHVTQLIPSDEFSGLVEAAIFPTNPVAVDKEQFEYMAEILNNFYSEKIVSPEAFEKVVKNLILNVLETNFLSYLDKFTLLNNEQKINLYRAKLSLSNTQYFKDYLYFLIAQIQKQEDQLDAMHESMLQIKLPNLRSHYYSELGITDPQSDVQTSSAPVEYPSYAGYDIVKLQEIVDLGYLEAYVDLVSLKLNEAKKAEEAKKYKKAEEAKVGEDYVAFLKYYETLPGDIKTKCDAFKAEANKALGDQYFKLGSYLEALEYYDACRSQYKDCYYRMAQILASKWIDEASKDFLDNQIKVALYLKIAINNGGDFVSNARQNFSYRRDFSSNNKTVLFKTVRLNDTYGESIVKYFNCLEKYVLCRPNKGEESEGYSGINIKDYLQIADLDVFIKCFHAAMKEKYLSEQEVKAIFIDLKTFVEKYAYNSNEKELYYVKLAILANNVESLKDNVNPLLQGITSELVKLDGYRQLGMASKEQISRYNQLKVNREMVAKNLALSQPSTWQSILTEAQKTPLTFYQASWLYDSLKNVVLTNATLPQKDSYYLFLAVLAKIINENKNCWTPPHEEIEIDPLLTKISSRLAWLNGCCDLGLASEAEKKERDELIYTSSLAIMKLKLASPGNLKELKEIVADFQRLKTPVSIDPEQLPPFLDACKSALISDLEAHLNDRVTQRTNYEKAQYASAGQIIGSFIEGKLTEKTQSTDVNNTNVNTKVVDEKDATVVNSSANSVTEKDLWDQFLGDVHSLIDSLRSEKFQDKKTIGCIEAMYKDLETLYTAYHGVRPSVVLEVPHSSTNSTVSRFLFSRWFS